MWYWMVESKLRLGLGEWRCLSERKVKIRPARRRQRERERTQQVVRIWIGLSRLILRDHRLVLSALFLRLVYRHCAAGVAADGGLDLNLDLLLLRL